MIFSQMFLKILKFQNITVNIQTRLSSNQALQFTVKHLLRKRTLHLANEPFCQTSQITK